MNKRSFFNHELIESNFQKPVSHIQKLIEEISPFAHSVNVNKGEILRYSMQNKRVCYLLHSGSVTLNRRGDGIIINSERAPLILGVTNQLSAADNLYLRVMEDSLISRLPLERFNLVVESSNLWESLCKTIIYTTSRVYDHCSRIAQMTSQELILFQLQELMRESDRVRASITAANYIRNRTYLSRSNIMRILADMRDEGAITLQRGILLAINADNMSN